MPIETERRTVGVEGRRTVLSSFPCGYNPTICDLASNHRAAQYYRNWSVLKDVSDINGDTVHRTIVAQRSKD
jgi:hypothetical protein